MPGKDDTSKKSGGPSAGKVLLATIAGLLGTTSSLLGGGSGGNLRTGPGPLANTGPATPESRHEHVISTTGYLPSASVPSVPSVPRYDVKYEDPDHRGHQFVKSLSLIKEKLAAIEKSIKLMKEQQQHLEPSEVDQIYKTIARELQELPALLCKATIQIIVDRSATQDESIAGNAQIVDAIITAIQTNMDAVVSYCQFNTQADCTDFYNNIAELKQAISQLPYKQGGGTDPSTALQITYNQLLAGTINPTADVPFFIIVLTDGVIEAAPGANQRTQDLMQKITAFNPNIMFMFMLVEGQDGMDAQTMPGYIPYGREMVFAYPNPNAVTKALAAAGPDIKGICISGTPVPSTAPISQPGGLPPVVITAITLSTTWWFLFPLLRKRQGFTDVDETEHAPALALLNQHATTTVSAATEAATANYQADLTQYQTDFEKYEADLAQWEQDRDAHAEAVREANARAKPYISKGPVHRTGESGFDLGIGDKSGATSSTTGIKAYRDLPTTHKESEVPPLRKKPTPPVPPVEPQQQQPDITNLLYAGHSTPASFWAITLAKGGIGALAEYMKWELVIEEVGHEAFEVDLNAPITSLLSRGSRWFTGDTKAAEKIGEAVYNAIPEPIRVAGEKVGGGVDGLLRWLAFSKAKRQLKPGDVIQFVNGVPTSIARRTDANDPHSVTLIPIVDPKVAAVISKGAPTAFSNAAAGQRTEDPDIPNPIFAMEMERERERAGTDIGATRPRSPGGSPGGSSV